MLPWSPVLLPASSSHQDHVTMINLTTTMSAVATAHTVDINPASPSMYRTTIMSRIPGFWYIRSCRMYIISSRNDGYLDLQSAQNNGLHTHYFGIKAILMGALEVRERCCHDLHLQCRPSRLALRPASPSRSLGRLGPRLALEHVESEPF